MDSKHYINGEKYDREKELMRKIIVAFVALMCCSYTQAQDFAYMGFAKADGSELTVSAENLTMTFVDGALCVEATDNSLTIPVSELNKMFFTNNAVAGIREIGSAINGKKYVYSLSGAFLGTFENMENVRQSYGKGVYLVKENGKTSKLAVR